MSDGAPRQPLSPASGSQYLIGSFFDNGNPIHLMLMNASRLASIVLAIVFFVIMYFSFAESGENILLLLLYLFFCIMLIWYGDELGNLTGVTFGEFAAPRTLHEQSEDRLEFVFTSRKWSMLTAASAAELGFHEYCG